MGSKPGDAEIEAVMEFITGVFEADRTWFLLTRVRTYSLRTKSPSGQNPPLGHRT